MTDVVIEWEKQPLGELTDAALAAQLGVSVSRVTHARRRLGIPGKRVVRDAERLDLRRGEAIDWDAQPLGQMPDLELAERLGTHRARVRLARVRRGIPLYAKPEGTLADGGPERAARWYRYPVTTEPCRCCREALYTRRARRRDHAMVRWTDQGALCAAHYGALPPCPHCGAPVMEAGDLCEACVTRRERAEREAGGWRRPVAIMFPTLARGEASDARPRR